MSRATVRAAISSWLTGAVSGINTVYSAFPAVMPGQAFFGSGPGVSSGAVAVVHIQSESETRVAFGGPTSGKKRVDYIVELHVFFRSITPAGLNSDQAVDAADALDTIIDALKARIRADRTAGSPDVWQWGEGQLSGQYGEPAMTGDGSVELWASITTQATEWLTT